MKNNRKKCNDCGTQKGRGCKNDLSEKGPNYSAKLNLLKPWKMCFTLATFNIATHIITGPEKKNEHFGNRKQINVTSLHCDTVVKWVIVLIELDIV